jgi:type I restriction enzyme R subunit
VETLILDHLFHTLPTPPYTAAEKQAAAKQVYQFVWQQSSGGTFAAL